jgi:L-lactate dehydrogenase (cytochrome)
VNIARANSIADLRRAARRVLPSVVFDYIDGGADDEITARSNETAFTEWSFRPRIGGAGKPPNITTTVLGTKVTMPLLLAPCGLLSVIHPTAGIGAARAALGRGVVSVLSTCATSTVEDVVAAAPQTVWFQLYAFGGRADAERLMGRAEAAGVEVLVVTADSAAFGNRERDRRHGVQAPVRWDARNLSHLAPQVLCSPRWAVRMMVGWAQKSLTPGPTRPAMADPLSMQPSPFSWNDMSWIRSRWRGKLVIKGVLVGGDARLALETGADAVVVSNHGGRQLDGVVPSIAALPEIVESVDGHLEVLLDGGIRRGSQVVRAVALGARAVLIGRPYLWGLAVAGQLGVERVLDIFHEEICTTMALLGCSTLAELSSDWVCHSRTVQP